MPDGTSDVVDDATLSEDAGVWLSERASDLDVDEDVLLERIVAAYRRAESTVEDGDEEAPFVTGDELANRLADVEGEFDGKIEDVRERVIQVKRETDAKASGDHDHEELAARVTEAVDVARDVEDAYESLVAELEAVADRLDAGFENYEEVLTYLRDETDALGDRTTTLATAVLAMRESVRSLAAEEARRERAEQLQREANIEGVAVADCGSCEQSVTVALLSAPVCPFCGAFFESVDPKSGWFGSHTLETGSKPALTARESELGDEDAWLGGDEEYLEEMASGSGDDGDGEPDAWGGLGDSVGGSDTRAANSGNDAADVDPDVDAAREAEVVDVNDPTADPNDDPENGSEATND